MFHAGTISTFWAWAYMRFPLLRRFYYALPIPARWRFWIGHFRRRFFPVRSFEPVVSTSSDLIEHSEKNHQEASISPSKGGFRDYFFFGVIDWHFRHQRPQQLALSLAKTGRRVFYISVNFANNSKPGFSLERLDDELALYQVFLFVDGPLSVYSDQPSVAQLAQLKGGLKELWLTANTKFAIHVIQHPFWTPLGASVASARTIYDCMDHHGGFSNTAIEHERMEKELLSASDLTIVTSDFLDKYARNYSEHVEIIRNAGEFSHFTRAIEISNNTLPRSNKKTTIGYYGAIAEWFDAELISFLADCFQDYEFVLIGDDSAGVGRALRHHKNIKFLGEIPYRELPKWLAEFEICLIPFRINDLTLATNPVKVYEYLSAGKPIVATDLPELKQFDDLVYRAEDFQTFKKCIENAIQEYGTAKGDELFRRRVEFARTQTWEHRANRLIEVAENCSNEPLVSVIVVSYNQWPLTERCLASLNENSDAAHLEIIVVDNGSRDETPARLQAWRDQRPTDRHAILNEENRGFACAVNQGLRCARGDFLVILNNDTIVSPGWARGLRRHLQRDPTIGLICPITNNIGNEAQVALPGSSPPEVFRSALAYSLERSGDTFGLTIAAFFCVMLPRGVWERIGELDERFFPGFFEDDDYCLRVRGAGWRIACAEDVFVYHELSASFSREGASRRQEIFERNKRLFEEKWGPWKPHEYRPESLPRQ